MINSEKLNNLALEEIAREVKEINAHNPAQQDKYPNPRELSGHYADLAGPLLDLVPDLHTCKEFCQLAGLDHSDPTNRNKQIIQAALIAYLKKVINQFPDYPIISK